MTIHGRGGFLLYNAVVYFIAARLDYDNQVIFAVFVSIVWPLFLNKIIGLFAGLDINTVGLLYCLYSLVFVSTILIIEDDPLANLYLFYIGIFAFPFLLPVWLIKLTKQIQHAKAHKNK